MQETIKKKTDVLVLGGGPAGMMAAHTAALRGKQVYLLERGAGLGRKILVTGKGRCNITNQCSVDMLLQNVANNASFLYGAFSRFTAQDTIAYFENSGLSLKIERGNRVFPASDRAIDVRNTLERNLRNTGVCIQQARAVSLLINKHRVSGVSCENGDQIDADCVIIATGGKSYPRTGSTGDGYELAKRAGHSIALVRPSLIPIVSPDTWCEQLAGLSLKNVKLSLYNHHKQRIVFSELGEMLFTHFGVSGPLALSASAHMHPLEDKYELWIDLKPGLSEQMLDQRLLRDFSQAANRDFANSLGDLLPKKLIPVIIMRSGIPANRKIHQLQRQERSTLVKLLKRLPIGVSGLRPIEQAIVTAGGVDVSQVSPKTMESKLVQGLFFAGEVLDVDAYTGGYNLQIAFSTGYTAGLCCETTAIRH